MAARFAQNFSRNVQESRRGEASRREAMRGRAEETARGPVNVLFLNFKAGRYGASRFFNSQPIRALILFQWRANGSLFRKRAAFDLHRPSFLRGTHKSKFAMLTDKPGTRGKFSRANIGRDFLDRIVQFFKLLLFARSENAAVVLQVV